MANIVSSWSLISFASNYSRMQVGSFVSKEDGSTFKSCIFTDKNDERTFVGFSSNLGELTPAQIVQQKNELQVVKLDSGTYKLCRCNNWEDVEL